MNESVAKPQPSSVQLFFRGLGQRYQRFLDISTAYSGARWIFCLFLMLLFLIRVFVLQGWYIVTYALGIYHLNLFLAFLTPKLDPALADATDESDPGLPTKSNEEFRPFIRRLPEFHFWYAATRATVISIGCTMFDMFNIPVFWPILLIYFIMLFILTMKRQIKHMIRYRYVPFTFGKRTYKPKQSESATNFLSKDDRGDSSSLIPNIAHIQNV